jgi:glycerophosphoryl diester phosphodiesterase
VSTPLPLIVAHRGACRVERENTVAAFEAAVQLGADMVELDVRRSADGVLVIHHDPGLPGLGPVSDVPWASFPTYVPTLTAALDACGDLPVNVEIKNDPDEPGFDATGSLVEATIDCLVARGASPFLISSFNQDVVQRVRELAPQLRTGFLYTASVSPRRIIQRCKDQGHVAIHPHHRTLTRSTVEYASEQGLEVNVWTVDDPSRLRTLASWGVTAVITNVPDVARLALSS